MKPTQSNYFDPEATFLFYELLDYTQDELEEELINEPVNSLNSYLQYVLDSKKPIYEPAFLAIMNMGGNEQLAKQIDQSPVRNYFLAKELQIELPTKEVKRTTLKP